jgi:coenzyme F420-0:L-glutamate ligase
MNLSAVKTRIFLEGENLISFITSHVPVLNEKSVLVVTSKIVALSEGRVVTNVTPETKEEWIRKESDEAIPTRWCFLTLKDGQWCANAGIDESNAKGGGIILLPKNSYDAAASIRRELMKFYGLREMGVLITDSRVLPLRAGVTGVALGFAGFTGLRDYVGQSDLFGRPLKMTKTNVPDSLAAASVLLMGEGAESLPLAIIAEPPVQFTDDEVLVSDLSIDPADDLYRPLFDNLKTV